MTDKVKTVLFAALVWLVGSAAAVAQVAFNGSGSTTHSAVTTAYTGNQLFALNTSGNAVATPIVINGAQPGQALAIKALIYSTGTNKPGTSTVWLFSAPPTTAGLVDYSPYLGPYLADLQANTYIGNLTCSAWQVTNDGTAKYFSECSGSSLLLTTAQPISAYQSPLTIYALEEIGAYTPISSEKHTYLISTMPNN